jgi:hypothetical protein
MSWVPWSKSKPQTPGLAADAPENIAQAIGEIRKLRADLAAEKAAHEALELRVRQLLDPSPDLFSHRFRQTLDAVFARLTEILGSLRARSAVCVVDLQRQLGELRESHTWYSDRLNKAYRLHNEILKLLDSGADNDSLIQFTRADITQAMDRADAPK